MVFLVVLQVFCQIADAFRKNGNLDFRGSRVSFVDAVGFDQFFFLAGVNIINSSSIQIMPITAASVGDRMAASWLALVGTLVVYHSLEAAATKIHEQRRFFILFHLPDQLFCRGKTDFITNFSISFTVMVSP